MSGGKILNQNELPTINGVKICAIYGRMETAHRTDQILTDAYDRKPDYYLLVTEDRKYDKGNFVNVPNLKIRKLPKEIAALFGKQKLNGTEIYVTRMYIRTRGSGNGSFTDQTIDLTGGCGATTKSICYYRLKRWDKAYDLAVFEGEAFGKKIENALVGKKYTIEELPKDFDVEYPVSYIRNVGGLNYPDLKLPSWRWLYGRPYICSDYSNPMVPNRDNIRVYFEPWNAHLYFERVREPQEGDENLVQISFPGYDKKGEQFCHISEWNNTKKEDPNGIIRWKILKVNKKENWPFDVAAIINDKVQFKRTTHAEYYRLTVISKIEK